MNNNPFSSAYCFASSNSTTRLFVKSALFPANAITIFGEACEMCVCASVVVQIHYVSIHTWAHWRWWWGWWCKTQTEIMEKIAFHTRQNRIIELAKDFPVKTKISKIKIKWISPKVLCNYLAIWFIFAIITCRCSSFTQVLARWKLSWFWIS